MQLNGAAVSRKWWYQLFQVAPGKRNCWSKFVWIIANFHNYNAQWHVVCMFPSCVYPSCVNTLRPSQNGRHFADDIFKRIFVNENVRISINISLKFVPKGPINNIPALVQIMAWRRPGDKPLSETMMVCLPTHICVTRPQWVNSSRVTPGGVNPSWCYSIMCESTSH